MHFTSIPSDCILLILNRIPLHDLLTKTNLVCRQWNALQPAACLRRRSLNLLIGNNAQTLLESPSFSLPLHNHHITRKSSSLTFRELTSSITLKLVTKLPNITVLQMAVLEYFCPTNELVQLNRLLVHWSSQLVSLKMYMKVWNYDRNLMHKLMLTISSNQMLSKIKNLTLDLFYSKILDQIKSFPVLFQLDQFEFNSADAPDKILGWLSSNPKQVPERIGFGDKMVYSAAIYRKFFSLSDEISTRITHLPFLHLYIHQIFPENQLGQFCCKFPAIESIKIEESKLDMSKIANQIKPLTQLVHLDIRVRNSFLGLQVPESDRQLQFPSVKLIEIELSFLQDIGPAFLHHYFPSVEVVKVKIMRGDITKLHSYFRHLKKCPILKHIYLYDWERDTKLCLSRDEL